MNTITTPTTIDEALDEIAAVRDAFSVDVDLIDRITNDDAKAFAKGVELLAREDLAQVVLAELLTHRLRVPADGSGRSDLLQGISEPGALWELDNAVESFRDRREAEAVAHLIATFAEMLDQSPDVRVGTRDWLLASMRAAMIHDAATSPEGDVEVFDEIVTRLFREACDERWGARAEVGPVAS